MQRILGKLLTENLPDPLKRGFSAGAGCRKFERRPVSACQGKPDMRESDGNALDDIGNGCRFGTVRLHEFETCRRRIKEIAHFCDGAAVQC